jgi:uncharacterized membrane protein HdeD (DUF308 family)
LAEDHSLTRPSRHEYARARTIGGFRKSKKEALMEEGRIAGRLPLGIQAEELDKHFGSVVALSIVMVLVGVVALFANLAATVASMVFLGSLFAVGGITQIVLAFSARGFSGVAIHLVMGVLSVITGVILWRAPLVGAAALTLVVATWLLVSGLGQGLHAIVERYPHWGMSLFSGLIGALLGSLLLATFPVSSLWYIGLSVGVMFLVQGLTYLSLSLAIHRQVTKQHVTA